MGQLIESKICAWGALLLCILVLILSMSLPGLKNEWWELTDVFFIFMMAFSHLAAVYLKKMSPAASRSLDRLAFVFAILALVAFIVIFILR